MKKIGPAWSTLSLLMKLNEVKEIHIFSFIVFEQHVGIGVALVA